MSADTAGTPIATAGCEPGDAVVIVPVPAPGLDAPEPVHATVTRASDAAIYAETDGGERYRRDRSGHLERASDRPASGLEATFWTRVAHDSELRRVEADGGSHREVYVVMSRKDGSPHPFCEAVYDNEEAARAHENGLADSLDVVARDIGCRTVESEYDDDLRADGGTEMDGDEYMRQLRDPENFGFMESRTGNQIHIVGTGLPPSILVMGGQSSGRYDEGDEKALCGLVSEFEPAEEVPDDVQGVLDRVCTKCNRQAGHIRNKGTFEEVPL